MAISSSINSTAGGKTTQTAADKATAISMENKMGTGAQIRELLGGAKNIGLASMSGAEKKGLLSSIQSGTAVNSSNANLNKAVSTYNASKAPPNLSSPNNGVVTPAQASAMVPATTTATAGAIPSQGTASGGAAPTAPTTPTTPTSLGTITNGKKTLGTVNSDGTITGGKWAGRAATFGEDGGLTGISNRAGTRNPFAYTEDTTDGGLLARNGVSTNKTFNPLAPADTAVGGTGTDVIPPADEEKMYGPNGDMTLDEYIKSFTDPLNDKITGLEQADENAGETTSTDTYSASGEEPVSGVIDSDTMTIQGQMSSLLERDESGTFTNPAIRQAVEAAMEQFAGRGLLNSSMASQAALEAAISKAIDIAGPDADKYFQNETNNVDWKNKFGQGKQNFEHSKALTELQQHYETGKVDSERAFTLQQNYLTAVQRIDQTYQGQVTALQNMQMSPEDKQRALDDLMVSRDNSVFMTTEGFKSMPQWEDEWSQSLLSSLPTGIKEKPQGIDLTNPAGHSRSQIDAAIRYAAVDPSYMTDDQFKAWGQQAVKVGLITQAQLDKALQD